MDSYYFLHTRSLCGVEYRTYKSGLMVLNSLALEMIGAEKRIKNATVYENPLYVQLFSDYAETDGIITFIEQCTSIDCDIDSDAMFDAAFPMQDAGFMGVDFSGITGITISRQVTDSASLHHCRICFWDRLIKLGRDEDLLALLNLRFPTFSFTKDAQKDLLWWKHNRTEVLDSIISLLDDIPANPFTGGIGKTEVLSNTTNPVASKRITQEARLTYTFGSITTIHRCKDHY